LFVNASNPVTHSAILSLLQWEFHTHQEEYGCTVVPDCMLFNLLAAIENLPENFLEPKSLDFVEKFNSKGIYLLNGIFGKYEAMVVAAMSISSTLR
jgi:hypothetical protein